MGWVNRNIWLWLAPLSILAASDFAAELAQAARSPQAIHEFVQTHSEIDWGSLLNQLGIDRKKITLPDCNEQYRCSSELITVPVPSAQTIMPPSPQLLDRAGDRAASRFS